MIRARTVIVGLAAVGMFLAGCGESSPETWQGTALPNWSADDSSEQRNDPDPGAAAATTRFKADAGLPELLRYAALNNPGLASAFSRWKAAVESVPQVKALPDPRFTYRYFIEEVETRVGSQRQSFGIAQTFPWFGKLALRGDAASEAAKAEYQRYEAAKLKLFYQVKQAYGEYYYLARAITVTEENIKLLRRVERVARTRYKVAAGSHPDVIRTQVELGKLDDRLQSLRKFRAPIIAALNTALNRRVDAPLAVPTKLRQEKLSVTDKQLLEMLNRSNPDLKALDREISKQKLRIALAKKDYFPDVKVGLDYIDTVPYGGMMNPSENGKDPVIAMVSVNVPIWWDKLSAGVREAKHRYFAALRQKAQKTNSLGSQLEVVLFHFHDAERKINLYRDTLLHKARQSLRVTKTSFEAGKGSFIDLIDAQRTLLLFELDYERALANQMQRLAELEMFVGKEISSPGNPKAPSSVK